MPNLLKNRRLYCNCKLSITGQLSSKSQIVSRSILYWSPTNHYMKKIWPLILWPLDNLFPIAQFLNHIRMGQQEHFKKCGVRNSPNQRFCLSHKKSKRPILVRYDLVDHVFQWGCVFSIYLCINASLRMTSFLQKIFLKVLRDQKAKKFQQLLN